MHSNVLLFSSPIRRKEACAPLMINDILDADEVAGLLRLNEQTVKRLANRGELPGFKVGGRWRFQRRDIEDYIEEQKRRYAEKKDNDQ